MFVDDHGLKQRALLVILDGFGMNPSPINNAVVEASTPNIDQYLGDWPHTVLKASGRAVGLPEGQMGNSEVGHLTLGSGSVVRQDLVIINDAIADSSFFTNDTLLKAVTHAGRHRRPVHLLGLVSRGGVHSHMDHLFALMELCHRHQARPCLHIITDGRDTPPKQAIQDVDELLQKLDQYNGFIGTVSGRFWAMDRDRRWDRTERAWRAIALCQGEKGNNLREIIQQSYVKDQTDEFILPTVLPDASPITADDLVISFNFRSDRPRQIVAALAEKGFDNFDRGKSELPDLVCLTRYSEKFHYPVAFNSDIPQITIGEVVSRAGLSQARIAETEKYAHVTYFLNGGREAEYVGESRMLIPSPMVDTYDLAPEMSAHEVADATIDAINSGDKALVVVNFANGDMVGHTAIREAVIKAVEVMDIEVGRVLEAAIKQNYAIVLTADHGNCDELVDSVTGEPHTQHSVYPVPCIVISNSPSKLAINAGLSSVAPTLLHLMGLTQPAAMTGESLLLNQG
ncbi:2,3-bisphosphoglycerate-independent phosphoglycerate mutase [hydrothermal vent metagenome]|uniref:phosphoglycerate mutase (2,3-diphosphoglycerate-independent) n=1 Tax=hydrothermal vent metagenome TaxID=652676 RepID=A0A3B0YMN6_9ZZZZ